MNNPLSLPMTMENTTDHHGQSILAVAKKACGRYFSGTELEDAVQEVMRRLAGLKGKTLHNPAGFVWVTAIRVCKSILKRKSRLEVPTDNLDNENVPSERLSPEEELAAKELLGRLREAVGNLAPDEKVVIEGLLKEEPQKDVAKRLGVTEPRVTQLKEKALATLRKRLGNLALLGDSPRREMLSQGSSLALITSGGDVSTVAMKHLLLALLQTPPEKGAEQISEAENEKELALDLALANALCLEENQPGEIEEEGEDNDAERRREVSSGSEELHWWKKFFGSESYRMEEPAGWKTYSAEERISTAKLRSRCHSQILFLLGDMIETSFSTKVSSAANDGQQVFFNRKYVKSLSLDELYSELIHQQLHVVFRHSSRQETRDPKRWNHATDLFINRLLTQEGLPLRRGAIKEAIRTPSIIAPPQTSTIPWLGGVLYESHRAPMSPQESSSTETEEEINEQLKEDSIPTHQCFIQTPTTKAPPQKFGGRYQRHLRMNLHMLLHELLWDLRSELKEKKMNPPPLLAALMKARPF